jgi:hypothetical protein
MTDALTGLRNRAALRRDWGRIVAASLLGLFAPQMTFLVAITMTTISIDKYLV